MREHRGWGQRIEDEVRKTNSFDSALEQEFAEIRKSAQQESRLTYELEGGLGAVLVDGFGHLLKVDIDVKAARLAGRKRLAERIVRAVNMAREDALSARVEKAGRFTGLLWLQIGSKDGTR